MGKSFLICSGKGGTGKTSTAVNLGAALSSFGKETMIVDADLPPPNLAMHLKIPEEVKTFNDLMRGTVSLSEASHFVGSKLKVLPATFSVESLGAFEPTQFRNILKTLEKENDITLIDCAPGLGVEVINSLRACDNAIIVLNPELPSLGDASKTIQIAQDLGVKIEGVIVNRTGRFRRELTLKEISGVLQDIRVLGTIPDDSLVPASTAVGHPVVWKYPFSEAANAFKKVAATLIGEKFEERIGFVDRFRSFIERYRA